MHPIQTINRNQGRTLLDYIISPFWLYKTRVWFVCHHFRRHRHRHRRHYRFVLFQCIQIHLVHTPKWIEFHAHTAHKKHFSIQRKNENKYPNECAYSPIPGIFQLISDWLPLFLNFFRFFLINLFEKQFIQINICFNFFSVFFLFVCFKIDSILTEWITRNGFSV